MVKENIRIFAISINKQESESDLSHSQESESEVQTTDSPALVICSCFLTLSVPNSSEWESKNVIKKFFHISFQICDEICSCAKINVSYKN